MLQARSVASLNALAAEGLPACIVVTHAGVMRAAAGHVRGLPTAEWSQLNFGYGDCISLDWPLQA
jgi:broad specificity phosphatase PhoE